MQAGTSHAAVTNYASTAEPSPTPTLFGVSLKQVARPFFTDDKFIPKEDLATVRSRPGRVCEARRTIYIAD
jgi:hypothetical protein